MFYIYVIKNMQHELYLIPFYVCESLYLFNAFNGLSLLNHIQPKIDTKFHFMF